MSLKWHLAGLHHSRWGGSFDVYSAADLRKLLTVHLQKVIVEAQGQTHSVSHLVRVMRDGGKAGWAQP